jgi:hypothetical protein
MLIPEEIKHSLPKLYSQESEEDTMIYLKFFNPAENGTWYLIEYEPKNELAFGYCVTQESELGYFSISELESIKLPFG